MKLVTFGKLNKKFLLLALLYILIIIIINILLIFLGKGNSGKKILDNLPIFLALVNGFLIFFIIFECWLRKTKSNEEKEMNSNEKNLIDI